MGRLLSFLLLPALLAAALAGCGGGGNSSGGGASSSSTTSTSSSSGGGYGGTTGAATATTTTPAGGSTAGATIKMQNIQFVPGKATAKVGQKVVWTNADTVPHNVTATSGATFKSGTFGQGQSYSFTPTKAGAIKYVCTLHPGMNGELDVTP